MRKRDRRATGTGSGIGTLLLLLLLLGTPPRAEAQEGRIVGRVTDDAGNPVAGARVTLAPADSSQPPRTATSGETGGFEFRGLPAGSYTVRASVPGQRSRELRVELEPGARRTVIARMRSEGRGAAVAEQRAGPGRP